MFDYSLEHPFRDYRIQQTNDHIKMKNMKTRLILFILLFISGFAIAGCKQQNQYRPDAKIVAAFNNKYPQADKVEWEQKQGYYVAEFREDGIEHEAWFDGTGKWVMTESNLRYSSLPQAIREQFEKSVYSTWKKDDIDKIRGLGLGADDYITKPFSVSELMAHVEALARRVRRSATADDEQAGSEPDQLVSGPFVLDEKSRVLYKSGKPIDLTQVEFQIMELFFRNPGTALVREKILEGVWGKGYFGDVKIVDVNIRRLRMKVEDEPSSPQHILTVWGYGYRWNA